jgi:chemotaxis protein methyltransferase CheR
MKRPERATSLRSEDFFETLLEDKKGFGELSQFLKQIAGIHLPLNEKNLSLMASRLVNLVKENSCRNYKEYLKALSTPGPNTAILQKDFLQALTTNTTQFFREPLHFEHLKNILPNLLLKKQKEFNRELRIWCAASSTGQEPYTLAMVLKENIPEFDRWVIHFLATDIDTEVLKRAANGVYTETEIQSVPSIQRQTYFHKLDKNSTYQANPDLRQMIRFAQLNLMDPLPFQHPFDIIFCRNVLIYFDQATAQQVVEKLASSLRPEGYLFLGHSESGTMRSPKLKPLTHAVYQRLNVSGGTNGT